MPAFDAEIRLPFRAVDQGRFDGQADAESHDYAQRSILLGYSFRVQVLPFLAPVLFFDGFFDDQRGIFDICGHFPQVIIAIFCNETVKRIPRFGHVFDEMNAVFIAVAHDHSDCTRPTRVDANYDQNGTTSSVCLVIGGGA